MVFKRIHATVPFSFLLRFILVSAIGIQIIVITYNHLSGYHVLAAPSYFFLRLLRGTLLSVFAGFLITYSDIAIIRYLDTFAAWGRRTILRITLQIVFSVILAGIISTGVTLLANAISPYTEELSGVLINNALIYSVVNLMLMAVFEGWIHFTEGRRARIMARNLQVELSQIKFEVLKSQINPHFMFNSLNVLSGLISKDTGKAQRFIDEFSRIYRYVLETIEQPVASLESELGFMRSYLFLQQLRYGETLSWTINIPADLQRLVMPPLSLQVVLENAIKHNIINNNSPLTIEVGHEDHYLVIRNEIQPKFSSAGSTGLGLKNLVKRYALISSKQPIFIIENNSYIAKLPLIDPDTDESSDHRG